MSTRKNGKSGFGFRARLLLMVLVPVFVIGGMLTVIAVLNSRKLADETIRSQLISFSYATLERYNALNSEPYRMENGLLMKGDVQISESYEVIDRLKEETGIDTTFFYGDTRVSTTLLNSDGSRNIGTQASDEVVRTVINEKNTFYNSKLVINGINYCVSYLPLYQEGSSSEVIGMIFAGIPRTTVDAMMKNSLMEIAGVMAVCMILMTIIVILLAGRMSRAILYSSGEISKIAGGKLAFEENAAYQGRRDEIGALARAAGQLAGTLTAIIRDIVNTAERLEKFSGDFQSAFTRMSENMGNIDRAVNEIAKGATSQALETQNANEGVTDIGTAIEDAVKNVSILEDSTGKMKEYNQSVSGTLEALSEISGQTMQNVKDVYAQTNATNDSANEIRSATDLITKIASKTNMLSLNASIEAARAGEMGRGFAVVAEEIRSLSEQSRESAEKIIDIVAGLLRNSEYSVVTMNGMAKMIEKQNGMIDDTLRLFRALDEEIGNVSQAVYGIVGQTNSLNETKGKVLGIVENLAAIAEENAASAEETGAAMTEMEHMVAECSSATGDIVGISEKLRKETDIFTF